MQLIIFNFKCEQFGPIPGQHMSTPTDDLAALQLKKIAGVKFTGDE
jgi:hypothetical protein